MSFILEQNFYNVIEGFPLENPIFAGFSIGYNLKEYDSYGIVTNSYPMYVRVYPLRGGCQDGHCISKEGRYANLDSNTRDKECPKIAWGFSAYLFDCLSVIVNGELHNKKLSNYVINRDSEVNFDIDETNAKKQYLNLLWNNYVQNHSGIKYRNISERIKRLAFLKQHINDERKFWKQTEPILKNYLCSAEKQKAGKLLYNSVKDITQQYCKEIKRQRIKIQYRWFYLIIGFVKKNTLKIISGSFAALLAYIYKDSAVALYHYICKLIERL
ncbi:MAG: hypothetical protein IKZ93_06465 [Prevotella sp.]|nr:hypothetical protein [Prevotella sp.]